MLRTYQMHWPHEGIKDTSSTPTGNSSHQYQYGHSDVRKRDLRFCWTYSHPEVLLMPPWCSKRFFTHTHTYTILAVPNQSAEEKNESKQLSSRPFKDLSEFQKPPRRPPHREKNMPILRSVGSICNCESNATKGANTETQSQPPKSNMSPKKGTIWKGSRLPTTMVQGTT